MTWVQVGNIRGPAGLVWRGPWDPEIAYAIGDGVFHNTGSFVAYTVPLVGAEPGEAEGMDYWEVLAEGGQQGSEGLSAYQAAVNYHGFVGTEAEWLASLVGPEGPGGDGGPQGNPGDSAYLVAAGAGFTGSEAEWLASLRGNKWFAGEDFSEGAEAAVDGDMYLLTSLSVVLTYWYGGTEQTTEVNKGAVFQKIPAGWEYLVTLMP